MSAKCQLLLSSAKDWSQDFSELRMRDQPLNNESHTLPGDSEMALLSSLGDSSSSCFTFTSKNGE